MSDVVGIQAVRAVLTESPARARGLYYSRGRRDTRLNEIIGLAKEHGLRHEAVERVWFDRRVSGQVHQGVLLECHELELADERSLFDQWDELGPEPIILLLDGITDPRNLGACLRSANAAGVSAVLLPKRRSAPLSAVAMKAAQGGAEGLRIVEVTNLARVMRALVDRGVWIIGAAGETEHNHTQMDAKGPIALVMGNEEKGLRRLTREHCDQLVRIEMYGSVDSLNVSVAAGILLFEARRQRA